VRVAGVARELLEELGLRGFAKTRATAASMSTCGSSRVGLRGRPPRRHRLRPELGSETRGDDAWWKEERGERIFVDFNQNTRDRTIASAYSLRPIRRRSRVRPPFTWDELAGLTRPPDFNLFTVPRAARPRRRPVGRDRRRAPLDLQPLLDLWDEHPVELELPRQTTRDARRAAPRAAVEEGRVALGRRRQLDRPS
jgi:hypothetical protein